MEKEFFTEMLGRLVGGSSAGITIELKGKDVVDLLDEIYQRGRADAERELLEEKARKDSEEFVTKAEAMKLLGKSDNTLWKWNRKGYLTWIKRGGTIVYPKSSVMNILNGKSQVLTVEGRRRK